jgi:hypothetical protein
MNEAITSLIDCSETIGFALTPIFASRGLEFHDFVEYAYVGPELLQQSFLEKYGRLDEY